MPDYAAIPSITALYAGILGLIGFGVASVIGPYRLGADAVSIGDGGRLDLITAMRRHANFAEWVPLALILIALLELNRVSGTAIHALGATLVVARLSHAFGFRKDDSFSAFRGIGAGLTVLVTIVASVWSITRF
jgi:uncharacterized membrane protein YecN with MAPEG domain